MVLVNVGKYTFVPWMPCGFLYVPLWRWFPTNVSSDDGKHVKFFVFFCLGNSFREVSPVLLGGRLQTGRRQLPRLSHRNASSPSQRRLGMTSDSDELEPTKKATCSFDIIGLPDANKNGTSFDVDMKITLLQMKISGSTEFIFFFWFFCCLFCQELCWLQPGLELFCILFRTHATWIEELSSWWFQIFYIFPESKGEMIQLYPIRFIFFRWVDKNPPTVDVLFILKNRLLWYPPQKTSEDDPTKLEKENHVQ